MNENTLTKALADHPDDVKTLFVGKTGVTGLGTLLTDKLNNLTQPSSGTIATEKQATQAQIDRLNTNITATKARLISAMTPWRGNLPSWTSTPPSCSNRVTI